MKVLMPAAAALLAAGVAAGCSTGSARDSGGPVTLPRTSVAPWPGEWSSGEWSPGQWPPGSPPSAGRSPAAPAPDATTSSGWEVTVYYTAVEQFHHGRPQPVTGCPDLNCSHGHDDLGSYPSDFVRAVHDEGTGRTAAGRYLNWSYDTGYWLDSAPRDTDGHPLEPYVTAAADPGVLSHGTRFTLAGCGRQDDGSAVPGAVCATLRAGRWRVEDEFTPGLGGRKHIDAYIGPETGPGFTDSDAYVTLIGATLRIA